MTDADRTTLREAGPFACHLLGAFIAVFKLEASIGPYGIWTGEQSRFLAVAIERLLNEAARPAKKRVKR